MMAILSEISWYLSVVFICISLLASCEKQFSLYLLTIFTSESAYSFQLPIFLMRSFILGGEICLSSLYILHISPLPME